MIRFACFVSKNSKCKKCMILFGEVAASLSNYVQFRGSKGSINNVIEKSL